MATQETLEFSHLRTEVGGLREETHSEVARGRSAA
jgi:hypothetical protein